jgi:acetyltransferase-like isoleucine patch superfamily enzyme
VLGDVSIGARAFIGANATIRNGVAVAADCVVGAGTLVKKDTLPGDVYSADETRSYAGARSREVDL